LNNEGIYHFIFRLAITVAGTQLADRLLFRGIPLLLHFDDYF
jgi:hypothetical protein